MMIVIFMASVSTIPTRKHRIDLVIFFNTISNKTEWGFSLANSLKFVEINFIDNVKYYDL